MMSGGCGAATSGGERVFSAMNNVDLKKFSKELQGRIDEIAGDLAMLACENDIDGDDEE